MATFYTPVETDEGIAHVLTKTRYLGIIPWARTSVTPHSRRELASLYGHQLAHQGCGDHA